MPKDHLSGSTAALERQVLRELCTGVSNPVDWDRLAGELSSHYWRDPDHKVVYQALRAIKSRDPKTRCDELPAQVTRMGFPDLDWTIYFEGEELSAPEIEELIRRLNARAAEKK